MSLRAATVSFEKGYIDDNLSCLTNAATLVVDRGFVGDGNFLPSYVGIIISQKKDPYETSSI